MEYSTLQPWQEINENGVIYDLSSLFAYLEKICDRARPVESLTT